MITAIYRSFRMYNFLSILVKLNWNFILSSIKKYLPFIIKIKMLIIILVVGTRDSKGLFINILSLQFSFSSKDLVPNFIFCRIFLLVK